MKRSKSSLNRMKFGGMIGYYPGTIWLDFGIDQVKGQGQGHEKVKILFLPYTKKKRFKPFLEVTHLNIV